MDLKEMKEMFDKLEAVAKRLLADQQEVITVIGMMRDNFQLLESMAPPPADNAAGEEGIPVEYEVLVDHFNNGRMFCVARFATLPEVNEFVGRLVKLYDPPPVSTHRRREDDPLWEDLYNNPYRQLAVEVKALFALFALVPALKNTP